MKIETPKGSGCFIEIFHGNNGNLCVSVQSIDCVGIKYQAAVELPGIGGEVNESKEQRELFAALEPFAGE